MLARLLPLWGLLALLGACSSKSGKAEAEAEADRLAAEAEAEAQVAEQMKKVEERERKLREAGVLVDCDFVVVPEELIEQCQTFSWDLARMAVAGDPPDYIGPDKTCARLITSSDKPARVDVSVTHLLADDVKPLGTPKPGKLYGEIREVVAVAEVGDEARWYSFGGGPLNAGYVLDYRRNGVKVSVTMRGTDDTLSAADLCPAGKLAAVLRAIDARFPNVPPRDPSPESTAVH